MSKPFFGWWLSSHGFKPFSTIFSQHIAVFSTYYYSSYADSSSNICTASGCSTVHRIIQCTVNTRKGAIYLVSSSYSTYVQGKMIKIDQKFNFVSIESDNLKMWIK